MAMYTSDHSMPKQESGAWSQESEEKPESGIVILLSVVEIYSDYWLLTSGSFRMNVDMRMIRSVGRGRVFAL